MTNSEDHRSRYPEQYVHALVGKLVRFNYCGDGRVGRVERVTRGRFGQIAFISSLPSDEALHVDDLTIVQEP